jgi:phosphate transport system substrate-binding protein
VSDPTAEGPEAPGDAWESTFARQAEAAGITLPKKSRLDPWTAVAVVVAIVLVTAGIGEVTGWINLRQNAPAWSYQTQSCSGNSSVHATGTFSDALGTDYGSWLSGVAQAMAKTVGRCFTLGLSETAGDGYIPPLGAAGSEFTATYAPPTANEVQGLPHTLVTVPVSLNAVAIVYNVPGAPNGLNLSAAALAGIFNGSVTTWTSPAIAAANPGSDLAAAPSIAPYHNSFASSATAALTAFLSGTDPAWRASVGSGTSVAWPTGAGAASDAAMLSTVEATPGSVGYLELYGMPPSGVGVANVEDLAGDFAGPSSAQTWVAAESLANSTAVDSGNWSSLELWNAPAPESYPLAVFSYVGLYTDLGVAYAGSISLTNASWLLGYVYWLTAEVSVAPLPPAYESAAVNTLNNETFDGSRIVMLENEQTEGAEGGETGEF